MTNLESIVISEKTIILGLTTTTRLDSKIIWITIISFEVRGSVKGVGTGQIKEIGGSLGTTWMMCGIQITRMMRKLIKTSE